MLEANAANIFFSKNEGLFKGSFSSSVIASAQGLAMARDESGAVAEVYSMDKVTAPTKNFQDFKKMAEKNGLSNLF